MAANVNAMSALDIVELDNEMLILPRNTVDKLRHIISGLNEQTSAGISKTGKKQDLIDRVRQVCNMWKTYGNADKWRKAKVILAQVRQNGSYSASMTAPHASAHLPPPGYAAATASSSAYRGIPASPPVAAPAGYSMAITSPSKPHIKFSPSPFYTVDQPASELLICPESRDSHDRKSITLTFSLTESQRTKLYSPPPGTVYQLRLYCTSSTYYTAPVFARTSQTICPIEFPPTCEVRVNTMVLNANLRGLKKKPGTAPPPDLGKLVSTRGPNKIEMIYLNSQMPGPPKKYYMLVNLVEVKSVDQIVERLRKGKFRSADEIKQSMQLSLSDDNDIIAGPQKMSLKCPLSYMHISIPCRSQHCVHSQCFDASSWFSLMEQTTTYLCPVCEKVLNPEELIVDGYFDDILKHTPESVEDVMVEADGEWHTTDGKHASPAWKLSHPSPKKPAAPTAAMSSLHLEEKKPDIQTLSASISASTLPKVEVFVLDSDEDDDEDYARVNSSRSSVSVPLTTRRISQPAVIDLTLDSDDDGSPPPRSPVRPSQINGKRKESDTNGDAGPSKRMRSTDPSSHSSPSNAESSRAGGGSGNGGGAGYVSPVTPSPRLNGSAYLNGSLHNSGNRSEVRAPSTSTAASTSPNASYLDGFHYSTHSHQLLPPPVVYVPPPSNQVPMPHLPNPRYQEPPYMSARPPQPSYPYYPSPQMYVNGPTGPTGGEFRGSSGREHETLFGGGTHYGAPFYGWQGS